MSPPFKRLKFESPSPSPAPLNSPQKPPTDTGLSIKTTATDRNSIADTLAKDSDNCSICLQHLLDPTLIPTCSHEFCFECLLIWCEQSRRCPLCSQSIGDHIIHHIRSKWDYQKHYLVPLTSRVSESSLGPAPIRPPSSGAIAVSARRNVRKRAEEEWRRRNRNEKEEADKLDRAISKRRWIYEHNLYAKHVASNSYTRYRPYPTPSQFAASSDLVTRMTAFLRRELRVWTGLDVEFLTTFILSLMRSLDIRSEGAINLLSEFLDMDVDVNIDMDMDSVPLPDEKRRRNRFAEHFAHEVYCYLRSPYRDLFVYDSVVQYDTPPGVPSAEHEPSRRWGDRRDHYSSSRPRSRSRSPSRPRRRRRSVSRDSAGRGHSRNRRRRRHAKSSSCERGGTNSRYRSKSKSPYQHWDRRSPSPSLIKEIGCETVRSTQSRVTKGARPSVEVPVHQSPLPDLCIDNCKEATPPHTSQPDRSSDIKGKRRASPSTPKQASLDQINTESTHALISQTKAPPQPPARHRPPRVRSLLESVHSHLNGRRLRPDVKRGVSGASTPLITLSGGSGVDTPIITDHPDSGGVVTPIDSINCTPPAPHNDLLDPDCSCDSNVVVRDANISDEQLAPKAAMGMSVPEVMARTRARLAKLKKGSAVVETGVALDATSPDSTSSAPNVWSRLLTRLEEEKRLAQQEAKALDTQITDISPNERSTVAYATAREARLRLHTRLAAAKRKILANSIGNLPSVDRPGMVLVAHHGPPPAMPEPERTDCVDLECST